jgi:hypothetical protein
MNILTLFLSFLIQPQQAKLEPQGYLDCAFDARNVYVCREDHGHQ